MKADDVEVALFWAASRASSSASKAACASSRVNSLSGLRVGIVTTFSDDDFFRRKLVDGSVWKFQVRDSNAPRLDLRTNNQAFVVENAAVVNQNAARLHVAKFAVNELRAVA